MLGALAVAAAGFLFAAPAAQAGSLGTATKLHNGINCTTWVQSPSYVYPADDTHMYVCVSAGQTVDATLADRIADTVQQFPTDVRNVLKDHGVTYFFFKDRDQMNSFMAVEHQALPGVPDPRFQSTTAQCGQTGYAPIPLLPAQYITVSVFEKCSYATVKQTENTIAKTAAHESGHAYDYSFASDKDVLTGNRSQGPSESIGFKKLVNGSTSPSYIGDINRLTPSDWASRSPASKANYVCNLFSTVLPSDLEIAFGTPNDKVCLNSTTINTPYLNKTPTEIAVIRAPYFIFQTTSDSIPYQEIFAEVFSNYAGHAGSDLLPVVDRILTRNQSPVPSMDCARWVVRMYWFDQVPPPAPPHYLSLQSQGCPNIPPSEISD